MDLGGTTFQPLDENRVPKLFAFEMKLKDWKRALTQAYRYSYFADKSFVVMPPNVINSNKLNLELFRTLDIGFIIFDSKTLLFQYCMSLKTINLEIPTLNYVL